VVIRRLAEGDGDLLREVPLRALADAPFAFSSRLEREREYGSEFWAGRVAESELGVSGVVFVAVDGLRSLGMAGGLFGAGQREFATLWGVWVDPNERRRGLGRELVEAVAGWARDSGAQDLRLALTDCEPSKPAASLYRGLGFVETGEHEQLESDPSLVAMLMYRSL
jgi:GNAT superfamily N-acetyltransferase